MPSDAQKRASNKYNAEHMATAGCKLKKSEMERLKKYVEDNNTTVNALLRGLLSPYIDSTGDDQQGTAAPIQPEPDAE